MGPHLRTRAEVNKMLGVDSEILTPPEIRKLLPDIDISKRPRYPILGALYHPPGGIIRHDAVVWAYARAADRLGVEIHNLTEVVDILIDGDCIQGASTSLDSSAAKTARKRLSFLAAL